MRCAICKGLGYVAGECHPHEVCDSCDGSGLREPATFCAKHEIYDVHLMPCAICRRELVEAERGTLIQSNWLPDAKPFTTAAPLFFQPARQLERGAMLGSSRKHSFGEPPPEKKPRQHKESRLQERVVKWARDRGEPVFRVEEARKLTPQAALRAKRLGAWTGVPDLVFPRIPLGLELKDTDGTTSAEQLEVHRILRECGWVVVVGWGYEDTITQLEAEIEHHRCKARSR